jgi:hypothetical protein
VPSANPRIAIPLAVGLSVTLAGCVSTQTKNARLVIENERTVDTQALVRVTRVNPQVAVSGIALVRAPRGAAIAVSLHNLASHPFSDLPISIGIARPTGARYYLNRKANLGYLDTHIVALGARTTTSWVLPLRQTKLPAGRLFADVGYSQVPAGTRQGSLPSIAVSAAGAGNSGGIEVAVDNRSGVPQARLPVYAVARKAGHDVAAGRATIDALSGGAHRMLRLQLLGSFNGATVELSAAPTIFN